MNWQELLSASRALILPAFSGAQPSQESLRRAISTAYYAMFHALAASNADCIIGPPRNAITEHAWRRVYRGLEHRAARTLLRNDQSLFSAQTRHFANIFGQLQDVRHIADYDPGQMFTRAQADAWISRAEAAITDFMRIGIEERTAVAVQSLIRHRPALSI